MCTSLTALYRRVHKIRTMFSGNEIIDEEEGLPFDYYLIGHCICHHGGMWDITSYGKEAIDLCSSGSLIL